MRLLTILLVVALPTLALAKTKVAVAPIDGDKDGSVAKVVAEAASSDATVTSPSKTGKTIDALGTDTGNKKDVKKLRSKLAVDVVVVGKVEKSGTKKHLVLTLTGKKRGLVELDFKTATSKSFKKELGEKLGEQIPTAAGKDNEDDEDEAAEKKLKKEKDEEEARAKKKQRDDEDDARTKKHRRDEVASDDGKKKHGKLDGDDGDKHHKKHRRVATADGEELRDRGDLDERASNPITQKQIWLDAGAAAIRRTLTYTATAPGAPPAVGTGAAALELDGEAYLGKAGTGLGVAFTIRQTVGLGVAPPGGSAAPITEAEYRVGARYRIASGTSSYAFGLDYWRRREIADRTGLMTPTALDMPDADYLAVAAAATARFALGAKSAFFASVELPYVYKTGPLTGTYPAKGGLGFGVDGGIDYALAARYALRFEATFDQVSASLGANGRGVTALTDRAMGFAATIAMTY